jgi:hypothetical protein
LSAETHQFFWLQFVFVLVVEPAEHEHLIVLEVAAF